MGTVGAYEWRGGALTPKSGWPVSTCSGTTTCTAHVDCQCPETRGLAAADLDHDGTTEIVAVTTQTDPTGAQVFVFEPNGQLYQPPGLSWTAWPRYNTLTGTGNDGDFNGQGNHGYGCYGENVGIGNLDDDANQEIVVTYDDHQVNVFNSDGTSMLASDWYLNPDSMWQGMRMGWGQFIRWLDPTVEDDHYHSMTGAWPSVDTTMWLQWTASPPNVADVDGDGKNEVVGLPNAEEHEPYVTQGFAFMALEGSYGTADQSARRLPAFETPVLSGMPAQRASGDYYPPDGIPAPTTCDISGDARPEIVAALNDGFVYGVGPDGRLAWSSNFSRFQPKVFASEVTVADLNKDGIPELVFGIYGPSLGDGNLMITDNTGQPLWEVNLPNQLLCGNGVGAPAAPTIADVDGDGQLEIVVSTMDHGVDVFTVPGSGTNCVLWPTGRGNDLRNGQGPNTKP
jgi:hypothetical protein